MWLQSLQRTLAILRKELLVLMYNPQSRNMLIVPPLIQIIFFAWAATMEVRNVDIAILNHDSGKWSHEVIQGLRGSPTFERILMLQNDAQIAPVLNEQKALAVIVFDASFSRDITQSKDAAFQVLLDGRRSNAAQILTYYLETIVQRVREQAAIETKRPVAQAAVTIAPRYWFNPNLEFQWFFLPNLIGILSFMLGLVVTGLSVAREREAGTFDQLLVSPATPLEIAIGKLLPGALIGLFHGTFFLAITHYGFDVPVEGSIFLLYVAMFVFAISAGGIGLMVSSFAATQQQAFLGAFTIGVPVILVSGTVSPIDNMPQFLQYSTQLNPLYHFISITHGIFLKDMSLQAVGVSLLKITAIAACTVSVSIWMFKRKA